MGILNASDWKGKWIGLEGPPPAEENTRLSARMLRKEFEVGKKIKRATAYVCGLGMFELYLNGEKVGNHIEDPAWTMYTKRDLYVTFDVTDKLKQGANAVGSNIGQRAVLCAAKVGAVQQHVLFRASEADAADGN